MLTRDGHDVVSVTDAQAALAAFAPEQFDLIVTDLGLPLTSGWSLLKEIRDVDPGVPALVMTGYGERADPERQSELSVHVVLAKPFLGAELRSAIDRALRAVV